MESIGLCQNWEILRVVFGIKDVVYYKSSREAKAFNKIGHVALKRMQITSEK